MPVSFPTKTELDNLISIAKSRLDKTLANKDLDQWRLYMEHIMRLERMAEDLEFYLSLDY